MDANDLAALRCRPTSGPTLDAGEVARHVAVLPRWAVVDGQLERRFGFADFHQTMAFVNAVAWVAHREDHHPELLVGYNRCTLRYSTHAAGGLTLNDFICAAKVDALLP
ncbi:MAG: 4a-hydroxytetrahydrobiopterin dehydratase [Rubrivivax sp.]|nr:4a-hydroxytetrahydrobiopterin dehydratase [Rubrivivax sp.]